jgi:hypothetical protein
MTSRLDVERAALDALAECAGPRPKGGRCAQGAALVKPMVKRARTNEADLVRLLEGHAVFEVKEVEATRFFGLFRRTRRTKGVALRSDEAIRQALAQGAPAPEDDTLVARCVAALCAGQTDEVAGDFDGVLKAPKAGRRSLGPLALTGAERVEASSQSAGADVARAKSELARLRRFAPGAGFEFSERLRANSAMAAIEAILQAPPELLEGVLRTEAFERWLRDEIKERELADLVTATRLRAAAEGMGAPHAKGLFIRLLSFSPLREAVTSGIVPTFVGKLTTAPEREVVEIVRVLEGLGSESVLEGLIKAVYEVSPEARGRVLMALGATGSPRVIDPLERLALHSTQRGDRVEAAAAVVRIAKRNPGPRAERALKALAASQDDEVQGMLDSGP